MTKMLNLRVQAVIPLAACFWVASLATVARAGDKAQFTGHWNFNQDQSDDAQQKVDDARANDRSSNNNGGGGGGTYPGGGGTYPGGGGQYPGGGGNPGGGGYPGGGGIWPGGGGMGRGGAGRNRGGTGNGSGVTSGEWDRLAENPKYLRIDQRSDQIVVATDSDQAQTFYPDGKKHDDKDSDGKKISTKTDWEGDTLVAETKMSHSEKLTQTFRLSPNGKQLFVTARFEAPSLSGPISIRRVYDLGKAATQ